MEVKTVRDNLIYLTLHGSRAYGIETPTSDWDVKGICISPEEYYFSPSLQFEQYEDRAGIGEICTPYSIPNPEGTIYELRKFFRLATDCNPNIIELLFTSPSHVFHISPIGKMLVDNREKFLSTRARYTFSGYAIAQLQRIKGHHRWLVNPPVEAPKQEDFLVQKTTLYGVPYTKFLEHDYNTALKHWNQYQSWLTNRNPERAALEAAYGLDVKHATHLVRLLRMGVEILRDGNVHTLRPDSEELLSIRAGAWNYERIVSYAEEQEILLEELYQNSPLPREPDRKFLEALCIKMIKEHLSSS